MKNLIKTIVLFYMLLGVAKAQFALQMGSTRQTIKSGDLISKQQLMRDTVRLVFLPDSMSQNYGVANIFVLAVKADKKTLVFFIPGNRIFPADANEFKLTEYNEIIIHQIQRNNGNQRPVGIKLLLTE